MPAAATGYPICSRNNQRKTLPIIIGSWNVRTLLDNDNLPRRRTAVVAHELLRYNIDICALAETRFHGEDSLEETGEGYTFFWKGVEPGNIRQHGVGFAIKTSLLRNMVETPVGINERLMTWRIPLVKGRYATLVSAYAPTLGADADTKEAFYDTLNLTLDRIPKQDKILLLGDFNARVGVDHNIWPGIIGRHGTGKCNSNGLRLLTQCAQHNLTITNTLFQLKNKYKVSWKHPRSAQW
ncbi:MAG: endonuclease/exonuclease/phosphatase family protein, partial [Cyanobacteria bacterium J06553_1]